MNKVWVIREVFDDGRVDAEITRRMSEVNLTEGYFESKEAALARCEELVKCVRSEWDESHRLSYVSDIEQLDATEGKPSGYGFSAVPRWCKEREVVGIYSAIVDCLEKHE